MTIQEAIKNRHSVRSYKDIPLSNEVVEKLKKEIEKCNKESGLNIQLVLNEKEAFSGFMAHYGKFSGVENYIALIGKKGKDLEEKCGYYGERIAILAQSLGLNTCWVAMTYKKIKTAFEVKSGEKLCLVIALGYGETQGVAHKSKDKESVMKTTNTPPEWFIKGVEAALLAPTAVNQQKFVFSLDNNVVSAKAGLGFYTNVDLGIVKYHFEIGAGKENFKWK